MHTDLAKKLGIEYPIFAFTHCRDVVAAVTNAGGIGVLGATGFNAEQLEVELSWIDERVGGKPYGVDVIIPNKYVGQNEQDQGKALAMVKAAIPQGHRDFVAGLCDENGVPKLPADKPFEDRMSMTEATSAPLVDVALQHDNCKLIANALGTPPAHVIKQVQDSGRMIGALCGKTKHAQYHIDAGLDFIIAMGGEGGGHSGDVSSVVLWPEVVKLAGDTPVIAAGGIGSGQQMAAALALGAEGVWCGSIWLTVAEAATSNPQKERMFEAGSSDTVRSKSFTGKPVRMLRNKWTDAWDSADNPDPLGAPMQGMLTSEATTRMRQYPSKSQDITFSPVGQIVGTMNETISARDLVMELVTGYLDSAERLTSLLPKS
ncbi:MAG: nitronate monooxygenase [Pseudomonadales bacterium]|nr:nitronate monooxygenase [Pseudomonadales bacterium]